MQVDELKSRIAAFPLWYYRFEFDGGVSTPVPDSSVVNRQRQRRAYFFEPLLELCGGTLAGRRVLDLGCSAGWWSLQAYEASADFVLGLDAQQMHVEQANLVFEASGAEPNRYRFETANVFEHALAERFDVVLCLGLLDRVARPVELFELIARTGAELIVLDTEISRARESVFELDSLYDGAKAVDHRIVLIPSRAAVAELAEQFGYETAPLAQTMTDYTGLSDYRRQRRLAFICSRGVSLDGARRETRAPLPWWVTALGAGRAAARRGR
ncbi:MAG TPA: methyltransferase domain-containing protein [Solirubrobacteraceae bacterium]|nr:methyltransferase domain-containing protein [Solirubrobacteraceae bacterium]